MDTVRICSQCRKPLADSAPDGLCAPCQSTTALGSDVPAPEPRIAPEPADLAPHFLQLEIIEMLGVGGMGMVYKARQPQLDRLVALKILPMDSAQNPSFTERFNREAKALAKLNHPGIVTVYDFGRTGPYYYFIMEYVDGMNLRELLASQSVTPSQTLELVVQICTALQYAHDHGVVHRDIKPANILVNKNGQAKIADFGLAKLLGNAPEIALTTSQAAMGTLNYMAPEQRQNAQGVDHRADIYSLGVVFYEMLTGEVPMGRFEPPSKKVQVDARLDEVVLRALESEPAHRYQHASEIKSGVEALSQTPAVPARRLPRWPWRTLMGMAALLALAVGLKTYAPEVLDTFIRPGPAELVARAKQKLEQFDRPDRVKNAMRDLRKALGLEANYTEALAWLGLAYWRQFRQTKDLADRSEAGRWASNALSYNPHSSTAWFVQGLVAKDDNRLRDATNFLSQANQDAGWEDGEVLIQLATVNMFLTNMSNTLFYVQRANEVVRKRWYFYNAMGSLEFSLGELAAAQSNYEAAVRLDDQSPSAWLNLGQILLYQTNRNENDYALKCFKKSLRFHASDAAYGGLGSLYMSSSNWLEAANNFQQAAELNPTRYDFPGTAGLALIRLPDASHQAKARELLSKAVEKVQSRLKEEKNSLAEANLGLYQAALGQAADAYITLRQAMERPHTQQTPDNVEAAAEYLEGVYHDSAGAKRIQELIK